MLSDGYHDIPPGKIASVVTSLQMLQRPMATQLDPAAGWRLRQERDPDPAWYRALFARMGRDWLWFSRLSMAEAELAATIKDSAVEISVLSVGGRDEGFVELDFREPGQCEVAFLAVSKPLQGSGAGRWLMQRALETAWSRPIERVWVHTCTLDHPGALGFYRKLGFAPYARRVEIADDPRMDGRLDPEAAPGTPKL